MKELLLSKKEISSNVQEFELINRKKTYINWKYNNPKYTQRSLQKNILLICILFIIKLMTTILAFGI